MACDVTQLLNDGKCFDCLTEGQKETVKTQLLCDILTVFGGGGSGSSAFLLRANNLSDLTNVSTARTNLGLGTAATANSSDFMQAANNLSELTNFATARSNLGLGTAAVQNVAFFLQSANNLSDVASAATSRTNLGLGTAATRSDAFFLQSSNNLSDLANTATARNNLGIGPSSSPTFTGATLSGMTLGSVLFAGTGGAIAQDNANFFWDDTNNYLGINTTPAVQLHVVSTSPSDPRGIMSAQHSTDVIGARVHFRKSRGTPTVPTVIVTGDTLGRMRFGAYDGANYLQMASIDAISTGTVAATRIATILTFSTGTDAAPSVLTERMRIDESGKVGIGTTNPSQKLDVVGSIAIPTTTNSTTGVIYKGVNRFIHNFAEVGSLGQNTFIGINAGNFTMGTGGASIYLGSYNTAVGVNSLQSNTTGSYNSTVGMQALFSNTTGYNNSAMGVSALQSNTTGNNNSAVGIQALFSNTTGISNSAVGVNSILSNTVGYQNSAVGVNSLQYNTTGYNNSALGVNSLQYNTTGISNSAVGSSSLYSNTTGNNNSALGVNSLQSNTTGISNSAVGHSSLYSNTTGNNNSAIGFKSGYGSGGNERSIIDTNSTFIGYLASRHSSIDTSTALDNLTVIGYDAKGLASNQVVIGNTSVTTTLLNGSVGIGITNPSQLLTIKSTGALGWDNGSGTADAMFFRGGVGVIEQRNGANVQKFKLYTTFTDVSNYERLALNTLAGASVELAAETLGTGGDNLDVLITAAGTGKVKLATGITIGGTATINQITKVLQGSAALDFVSVAGQSQSATMTITVTGAVEGDPVFLGLVDAAATPNIRWTSWVSAANTVSLKFFNGNTVTAVDLASLTYKVSVLQQ